MILYRILRYFLYLKRRRLWLGAHGSIVEYCATGTLSRHIHVNPTPTNLRRFYRLLKANKIKMKNIIDNLEKG